LTLFLWQKIEFIAVQVVIRLLETSEVFIELRVSN